MLAGSWNKLAMLQWFLCEVLSVLVHKTSGLLSHCCIHLLLSSLMFFRKSWYPATETDLPFPTRNFKKVESKNIRKSFFWPLYRWDHVREMGKNNVTKKISWWEKEQCPKMDVEILQHKFNCGLQKHCEMLCHLLPHSPPPSSPISEKITLLHITICYLVTWMRTSFFLNSRSYFSPYLVVQ